MAGVKRYFVALRHIVPSDLEYYLEEENNGGYQLEPLKESSLLYYSFEEGKAKKCSYVVDATALPRSLYAKALIDQGWELMGKSMNCYVWRQYYEKERPENFSDKACLRTHCLRMGIVLAAVALLVLGLGAFYFVMLRAERMQGNSAHFWPYLILGLLQLPFFAYFAWAARGLLREAARIRERLALGREFKLRDARQREEEPTEAEED